MSFHDLNKDLLTKLVETISEDKQKEIDELKSLLERYEEITTKIACCYHQCKAYTIIGNDKETYINCRDIYNCDDCGRYMCDQHQAIKYFILCLDCETKRRQR